MLFLVGFNRRLVATITAFTLAHSLTLALSALGWLTLRSPPVEATIALSIVLVAGEALHRRPTLSRRWPALVAFLFGLVHGLGFAGALKEIGLPEHHLPLALLTFNVGVELGQLAVVGVGVARAACAAALAAGGARPRTGAVFDRHHCRVLVVAAGCRDVGLIARRQFMVRRVWQSAADSEGRSPSPSLTRWRTYSPNTCTYEIVRAPLVGDESRHGERDDD